MIISRISIVRKKWKVGPQFKRKDSMVGYHLSSNSSNKSANTDPRNITTVPSYTAMKIIPNTFLRVQNTK